MRYVIQRDDGYFVTPSGSRHSYTRSLQCARTFETKEEAEGNRCPENERVVSIESLLVPSEER
jgi:hypothetical protein